MSDWKEIVENQIEEFSFKNGIDRDCIRLVTNTSRDGEKETSFSIAFFELNSITGDKSQGFSRTSNVVNFIPRKFRTKAAILEVAIPNKQFNYLGFPESASIKGKSSRAGYTMVSFSKYDDTFGEYVGQNIAYCYNNYVSKESPFACCHRFRECSEAMRCLHPNGLFARGCKYRANLEKGNNFLING